MRALAALLLLSSPAFAHHSPVHRIFRLPFRRPAVTRNASGDLVLRHGNHTHVYDQAAQTDYQRYLTACRHLSHCASALLIEQATPAELKTYLDWLDRNAAPQPFPARGL